MTDRVVKVPDIGEGIAEVELVEWHVAVGDTIVADQVLADLMTDKATVEVPAPVAGVVTARNGNPGDKLAVGSELVRIAGEGAAAAVASTASGADADAATVRAPAKAGPPAPAGAAAPPAPAPVESAAAPVAPATGKPPNGYIGAMLSLVFIALIVWAIRNSKKETAEMREMDAELGGEA